MTPRRIILSGCSGGGKSTLLQELARRGYATVPEPGRRVISEQRQNAGQAVPWIDPKAFCSRVIDMALSDFAAATQDLVIFDRSALDALIWFDRTETPLSDDKRCQILSLAYERRVFLVPPWPEVFRQDRDRRHSLTEALAEYQALCDRLPEYGFQIADVPKRPIGARADWLEAQLRKGWTT